MDNTSTLLDADELLHLALLAARDNLHDIAINHLKKALAIDPSHAKVHYFLAAEHAQIGMFDRAVEGMEKTVSLDPTLHTAHFQLGLLYLTSGRAQEAVTAWTALDSLDKEHPLYLFKSGLEALAADRFADCRELLNHGMLHNTENPDLNADMQRVLDTLPGEMTKQQADSGTGHVFLSAYGNGNPDN